jgi:hypothetical protein
LVRAGVQAGHGQRLEDAQGVDRDDVGRELGQLERRGEVALRGQIVDLVELGSLE